ncbi:MAG: enolase [Candidatus Latescibacteria bacterium]|nr:enolase [Candidatus Latescibacterota bacterium]
MKIKNAQRIALNIPFVNRRVQRAMQRALTCEERVYVYRLQLEDGTVGWGDETVARPVDHLVGQNALALLQNDGLGFGPQVALYDAVGRATDTPLHALLGPQVRDRSPLSWWAIDMAPRDWVAEAKTSLDQGYTSFKIKARPWWDIFAQIEALEKVIPADYQLDIDFNGFLCKPAQAEIVLAKLDRYPNVGLYESPFHLFRDLDGARLLRQRIGKPLVEHFRFDYLPAGCVDALVVYGGGLNKIRREAELAAAFNKPFWLQLVGAGLTTACAVHLGAVLSHAQLPSITCRGVWAHDLLQQSLTVQDGYVAVSDAPGLGVEVDEAAIERYRVAEDEPTPTALYRRQKRILRISWPGGNRHRRIWDFTDEAVYQPLFYGGDIPGFERGVRLDVIEDDSSPGFCRAHDKLLAAGR